MTVSFAGIVGLDNYVNEERPTSYRQAISYANRAGTVPIFAFLDKTKKQEETDIQFNWWSEVEKLPVLSVSKNHAATDTLIQVTGTDPTANDINGDRGSALNLRPNDILQIIDAANPVNAENMRVISVQDNKNFIVRRGELGTTPVALTNTTKLMRIGSSHAQGTGAAAATSASSNRFQNTMQLWKTTFGVDNSTEVTEMRINSESVGKKYDAERKKAFYQHAGDIERALVFSKKSISIDDKGNKVYTTDGILHQIPSTNIMALPNNWAMYSKIGSTNLMDMIASFFVIKTGSGNKRMALCGQGTLSQIVKAVHASSAAGGIRIQLEQGKNAYGLEYTTLITPHGSIDLVSYPNFSELPQYNYTMLVIDWDALGWRYLRGRDTNRKDDIQNPDEDLRKGQWLTEGGLMVDYGGLSCGLITGFEKDIL